MELVLLNDYNMTCLHAEEFCFFVNMRQWAVDVSSYNVLFLI